MEKAWRAEEFKIELLKLPSGKVNNEALKDRKRFLQLIKDVESM